VNLGPSKGGLAGLSLAVAGCTHVAAPPPSPDVLAVTVVAARYALDHEVPAVLRDGSTFCLEVEGGKPPAEVLARLNSGALQVSGSPTDCAGPRAVLLQVDSVVVSGETARARASVPLAGSRVLQLRKVEGQWRVLRPPGPSGASQLQHPPGSPLSGP
jgi:hypothetical protein